MNKRLANLLTATPTKRIEKCECSGNGMKIADINLYDESPNMGGKTIIQDCGDCVHTGLCTVDIPEKDYPCNLPCPTCAQWRKELSKIKQDML